MTGGSKEGFHPTGECNKRKSFANLFNQPIDQSSNLLFQWGVKTSLRYATVVIFEPSIKITC
jgi:hypothetical protein